MAGKMILTLSLFVIATQTWADGPASVEKSCLANKKSKPYCACLERNVGKRVKAQELSEEQLKDLADLAGGRTPASEADKAPIDDAMADYFAGLEFHCHENPKYSAP